MLASRSPLAPDGASPQARRGVPTQHDHAGQQDQHGGRWSGIDVHRSVPGHAPRGSVQT
jgi:hypothetical protein